MEKKTTQLLSQINQKMKVAMLSASSYSWTLMPRSMVSKTLKAPTPVCRYYWAGMSSMWRKRRTKEIKDFAQLGRARWTHTRSKRTKRAGLVSFVWEQKDATQNLCCFVPTYFATDGFSPEDGFLPEATTTGSGSIEVSSRWLGVPAFRLWHRLGVAIEKNAMNGEPIRKRYNECSS